ncbi:MAG: hypothetical protein GY794_15465 [bacterium]|nr:hypothetical protein [bacterium]
MLRSRIFLFWTLTAAIMLTAPPGALSKSETKPAPAKRKRITYLKARELAKLENKGINESSGLAAGRRNKGVLWTHNDSGDSPRIFAINHDGADLATVTLSDARAQDWEDICSFTLKGKNFLLLGDFGDNMQRRKICTLYIVAEPKLNTTRRGAKITIESAAIIPFVYKGGPRNCESVGVDTTTRTIYLVSKPRIGACRVYTLPLPTRSPKKPLTAKPIAALGIPISTAMDISPDGLRAVVLTYRNAYEYVRGKKETWKAAFAREPRMIRIPARRQGESICYGPDGRSLYLTSEKLPTPLIHIPAKKP